MNIMAPVAHPGRLLKRELAARRLSANRLWLERVIRPRPDILNGRLRSRRMPRCARRDFGKGQFWLDLQGQYDMAMVEREKGGEIAKRVRPADAA